MNKEVSIETVGLSHREFLTLYWLSELQYGSRYPRELYKQLLNEFPGKPHSYDYLCRVAKKMKEEGLVTVSPSGGKQYYSITLKGEERLKWYQKTFEKRMLEVKKVIDRLVFVLTKNGTPFPVEKVLDEQYRGYFSKLVSVKDIIRYLALKIGQTRTSFYMSEIDDLLEQLLGWRPSNSYLYHVAREMEAAGLVVGKWMDERRTKRYLTVTEEGVYHFRQIAQSTRNRAVYVQHYLNYVLRFLQSG